MHKPCPDLSAHAFLISTFYHIKYPFTDADAYAGRKTSSQPGIIQLIIQRSCPSSMQLDSLLDWYPPLIHFALHIISLGTEDSKLNLQ
jgi:hypothetical protein